MLIHSGSRSKSMKHIMNDNNQKLFSDVVYVNVTHICVSNKKLNSRDVRWRKKFHLGDRIAAYIWYDTRKECVDVKIYEDDIAAKKLWCCIWSMVLINMTWSKKAYLLAYIFTEYNLLLQFYVELTLLQFRVKMFTQAVRCSFYGCNQTKLPFFTGKC